MAVTVNCKGTLTTFCFSSKMEDQVDKYADDGLIHLKVQSVIQSFSVTLVTCECRMSTVQAISGP